MNHKELYNTPARSWVTAPQEEIDACVASFEKMVKKHKDCQALVARNVGVNLDLCYIFWDGYWKIVSDLKVMEDSNSGYYKSSEGSYDCAGRFKVNRARACKYSGIELRKEENGKYCPDHFSGKANGNFARVLQRMYNDNHGKPIWVAGRKYLPVDPVRYGIMWKKKDQRSIVEKLRDKFKKTKE